MAIFFSAATAAGAFGGLLARGIMEMRGVAGLSGWQWIFILEGILTFFVGKSLPLRPQPRTPDNVGAPYVSLRSLTLSPSYFGFQVHV